MSRIIWSLTVTTLIIVAPLQGVRHSRTKQREPIEKKYVAKKEHSLDLKEILSKQTKDLTFEQAKIAREHYTKEKNNEMIIKCDQRVLALGGDQELMRIARLELAELFLEKGTHKEAEKYALEYLKYYPGAAETKRASYIAVRANFLSRLSSDRDQEKTRTTVTLGTEFLKTYQDDTEYIDLIKEMLDSCYKSLIRSELRVIETQLNNHYYSKSEAPLAAAEKRLEYIQENLLPHAPVAQKKVTSLEAELKLLRKNLNRTSNETEGSSEKPASSTEEGVKESSEKSDGPSYLSSLKDYFFEDNKSFFA